MLPHAAVLGVAVPAFLPWRMQEGELLQVGDSREPLPNAFGSLLLLLLRAWVEIAEIDRDLQRCFDDALERGPRKGA